MATYKNSTWRLILKTIETLSEDIYHVLDPSEDHEHDSELAADSAMLVAAEMAKATVKRDKPREKGKLWASDIGKPCMRQHHYNFNNPDEGEKIDGHTKFKFLYGNILEEAVLYYAREAGHTVTSCQARVDHTVGDWNISGKIDAIIDDTLIDVKSTSSYGYKKYTTEGLDATNDSFGYRWQLGYYKHMGDFEITDDVGFVWIDKQNGHIAYTPVDVPSKEEIEERIHDIADAVEAEELDVPRAFSPEPFGKSGNMKLPVGCSYCSFKKRCWRDANNGQGLKGYVYSHGPVWFTEINRPPKATVPEIPND